MAYLGADPNSVRRFGAEDAFRPLRLSKRAVSGLVRAGVLSPNALIREPWTDEEAGRRFNSLSWRLSVDPECGPKTAQEIGLVRQQLLQSAAGP